MVATGVEATMPGGAQAILATPPSSKAMSRLIDGLAPKGKLMVIGEAIQGYVSGTPTDSEDTRPSPSSFAASR
ncbi:MAG TPA: hypothetical protein VFB89_15155 [Gemmatimonadales bacterium]|nr:hypothetical protein [Gemmatimonadales bacterium]